MAQDNDSVSERISEVDNDNVSNQSMGMEHSKDNNIEVVLTEKKDTTVENDDDDVGADDVGDDEIDAGNEINEDTGYGAPIQASMRVTNEAVIMAESGFPNEHLTFATNKNIAEGMMDIALLSANANQLRFLITYNREATFFYISLALVIISLVLQLAVGIGLLIRRRSRLKNQMEPFKTNTFIVSGVFIITMVNVLLAALTTTDNNNNNMHVN